MSDSGPTGLPPAARPPHLAEALAASRADSLKVTDINGILRQNVKARHVTGEVVAENRDGTVRIATPDGDITVQKPAARPDLIVGARVEVDVPAGRPPQRVQVREAATQQQNQVTQSTQTPSTQTPRPDDSPPRSEGPPSRTAPDNPVITAPPRPPVDIPEQPPVATPQIRPAPVTPEQIVRLLPLPPGEAARIIVPPTDISDIVLPAINTAQIIAANAVSDMTQALTDALIPLPAPAVTDTAQVPLLAVPVTAAVLPAVPSLQGAAATAPAPSVITTLLQTAPALAATITPQASAEKPARIPASTTTPALQFGAPPAPENFSTPTSPAAQNNLTPLDTLLQFTRAPASTQLTLQALPLNAARAAALAISPPVLTASFTGTPLAAQTQPVPTQQIPKLDAQLTSITPPPVFFKSPEGVQTDMNAANVPLQSITAPQITVPDGNPMELHGTVRGLTAQNFPVLSLNLPMLAAVQDFILQFPAQNLPAHAQIGIMPQPGTIPAAALLPQALPIGDFLATTAWPALDEAFQALQHAAPQAAQAMAQTALGNPAAPARLPAIAMMFIAAVQGGDLQNWLGEKTIDALRRIGKGDVLNRLGRDVDALSRLNPRDGGTQDWRTLPLPMLWDNHAHKVMLHYRHDREKNKDGELEKKGTRFIVDLSPARMGRVQLDGLHRPAPDAQAASRLDLIVRTREQISPAMQQLMRRLYTRALDQSALAGELSFHNKPGQWVDVKATQA